MAAPLGYPLSAMLAIFKPGLKSLPVKVGQAYLASSLVRNNKSFIILTPGSNVIKLFTGVIANFHTELECLLE
jgi:hypothetical protein